MRQEAHRLARTVGGTFVVYAPMVEVKKTPETVERVVLTVGDLRDDFLPF